MEGSPIAQIFNADVLPEIRKTAESAIITIFIQNVIFLANLFCSDKLNGLTILSTLTKALSRLSTFPMHYLNGTDVEKRVNWHLILPRRWCASADWRLFRAYCVRRCTINGDSFIIHAVRAQSHTPHL
jgi:hypothetical protein